MWRGFIRHFLGFVFLFFVGVGSGAEETTTPDDAEDAALREWKAHCINVERHWKIEPGQELHFLTEGRRVWLSDGAGLMVMLFDADECIAQVKPSADGKRLLILVNRLVQKEDATFELAYSRLLMVWISDKQKWQTRPYLKHDSLPLSSRNRSVAQILDLSSDSTSADLKLSEKSPDAATGVSFSTKKVILRTGEEVKGE